MNCPECEVAHTPEECVRYVVVKILYDPKTNFHFFALYDRSTRRYSSLSARGADPWLPSGNMLHGAIEFLVTHPDSALWWPVMKNWKYEVLTKGVTLKDIEL